jgi:predicted nucleic acid-binding protein
LVREIGDEHDWEVAKRREFQNDVLIALMARRYGAFVVTRNREDFERLAQRLRIRVIVF